MVKRYKIRKVFKDQNKRARVLETGLTLEEAQKMVEDDVKVNPKALRYMLTYVEQ